MVSINCVNADKKLFDVGHHFLPISGQQPQLPSFTTEGTDIGTTGVGAADTVCGTAIGSGPSGSSGLDSSSDTRSSSGSGPGPVSDSGSDTGSDSGSDSGSDKDSNSHSVSGESWNGDEGSGVWIGDAGNCRRGGVTSRPRKKMKINKRNIYRFINEAWILRSRSSSEHLSMLLACTKNTAVVKFCTLPNPFDFIGPLGAQHVATIQRIFCNKTIPILEVSLFKE